MSILLHLLQIYTSQASQDNQKNTIESIDEVLIINSSLLDIECPEKRSKQLDHPFKSMEVFLKTFDHNKNLNTTSESDLVRQSIKYVKFSEFEANYTINQEYSEETTKLGNLSNKSCFKNITLKTIKESSIELPHQEEEGRFIREIRKIIEQKQKQRETYEQQREIKKLNEDIEKNFSSKIEELKSKNLEKVYIRMRYRYDKENVACLYSYLLKSNVSSMENLDLLQILISEIEYNNKIMIFCLLQARIYKILCFITENLNYLVISPLFFYNVGRYMGKISIFVNSKDIERGFFNPFKENDRTVKRRRLDGFLMVYKALKIHSEINLPEIFGETKFEKHEQAQLAIVTLYNMIKEGYNHNLCKKTQELPKN